MTREYTHQRVGNGELEVKRKGKGGRRKKEKVEDMRENKFRKK